MPTQSGRRAGSVAPADEEAAAPEVAVEQHLLQEIAGGGLRPGLLEDLQGGASEVVARPARLHAPPLEAGLAEELERGHLAGEDDGVGRERALHVAGEVVGDGLALAQQRLA